MEPFEDVKDLKYMNFGKRMTAPSSNHQNTSPLYNPKKAVKLHKVPSMDIKVNF